MTNEDLACRFDYHAPTDEKKDKHAGIRQLVRTLALDLNDVLPDGREKSLAMTKLEEAMFWSNAAIARDHE